MRIFCRWSLLVLIPLFIVVGVSYAQWTNIAPDLVPAGAGFSGAMQFNDGIVWAGGSTLWSSRDSGKTWQQSKALPEAQIADIAFYDQLHGLVATEDQGLFVTIDGGNTWKQELKTANLVKVGYDGSNQHLIALDIDGPIHTSMDGGNTWGGSALYNGTFHSFAVAQDGTIYVEGDTSSTSLGSVLFSNDYGNTWNVTAGTYNGDSWTLAVDSCDSKRLYLTNEEWQEPDSLVSHFYVSLDGGQSWQTTDTKAKPYLSGSMSTTNDGVFVGTQDGSGVHRSMDRGLSWKPIGGPSNNPDTRNIAAINDDIVLAADGSGNIWLTTNGGGDSVASAAAGSLVLSPASLFDNDSLQCTSVVRSIRIVHGGCGSPSLDSTFISGPNSGSYQINSISNDSITVTLQPQSVGTQNAWLVGLLNNGNSDTVFFDGVGIAAHTLSMVASSSIASTDTIGATVELPITIDGLAHAETVEMVLQYPLPDLEYLGSFDPSGNPVDVPGASWPGRALLKIPNAKSDTIAAYAHFNVFSDTAYDPIVTFDSVNVLTASASCEYSSPPAVSTTIIPLEGCGDQLLSQWFHLGKAPLFGIIPNPSNGSLQLTSSITLGDVWVDVYDVLGKEQCEIPVSLMKDCPAALNLPFESGLYFLRISSSAGHADLRVMISK